MIGRIIILSDTHLGRPDGAAVSAAALRPLWQGCNHLVLNGDVAEVHHPIYRGQAAREVMQLLELAERDGVQVTMLSGNHDPYLSDVRHLRLANGRVFITHGDVLHPAIAPWSPAADKIRTVNKLAMARLEPGQRDRLEHRLAASQHAASAEWAYYNTHKPRPAWVELLQRPWLIPQILLFWKRIPHLAAAFAAEHVPDARFILLGHTHRQGIWHLAHRVIINTGCYGFPGKPWAVVLDQGELAVRPVLFDGTGYRLSMQPVATFPITDQPQSPGVPGVSAVSPLTA